MTDEFMASLARLEQSIRASDGEAIKARWEFGREVLTKRQGKKLPTGLTAEICKRAGIAQAELSNRTRVAEAYDVAFISSLINQRHTWTAIVAGLPKKQTKPKAPPKLREAPTPATIKEANRVADLLAKPDVQAELLAREVVDKTTEKARKAAERKRRTEEKAQKERDQEAQHRQQVLRDRLVRGDTDWQNLTEQMETMADTVKRLVALLDGLPIPDPMRRKMFEKHLAAAQQALFELRLRLGPERYEEAPAEVRSDSVIEVGAR